MDIVVVIASRDGRVERSERQCGAEKGVVPTALDWAGVFVVA